MKTKPGINTLTAMRLTTKNWRWWAMLVPMLLLSALTFVVLGILYALNAAFSWFEDITHSAGVFVARVAKYLSHKSHNWIFKTP